MGNAMEGAGRKSILDSIKGADQIGELCTILENYDGEFDMPAGGNYRKSYTGPAAAKLAQNRYDRYDPKTDKFYVDPGFTMPEQDNWTQNNVPPEIIEAVKEVKTRAVNYKGRKK